MADYSTPLSGTQRISSYDHPGIPIPEPGHEIDESLRLEILARIDESISHHMKTISLLDEIKQALTKEKK